jgi:hypothetical protein
MGSPLGPENGPAAAPAAPGTGPGVTRLLAGLKTEVEAPAATAETSGAPSVMTKPAPRWLFFAADFFLLVLVALLVFNGPNPLSPLTLAFCSLAIVLAAVLGIAPFYLEHGAAPPAVAPEKLPKWMLGRAAHGAAHGRPIVLHLHWPRFALEPGQSQTGDEIPAPVWIDAAEGVSPVLKTQLLREAAQLLKREENGLRSAGL